MKLPQNKCSLKITGHGCYMWSPNHFKPPQQPSQKPNPKTNFTISSELPFFYLLSFQPETLLSVSCKASNSFCRCSNRCWCAASLDAEVAFSSANIARSWKKYKTVHWRRADTPSWCGVKGPDEKEQHGEIRKRRRRRTRTARRTTTINRSLLTMNHEQSTATTTTTRTI